MATRKKKLNGEIFSVRDFGAMGVQGVLGEVTKMRGADGQVVLGNFGQELETMELANPANGEIKKYWVDGGIRGALSMTKVKPGTFIEIVHTGTKQIDQGMVQTYDIFEMEV